MKNNLFAICLLCIASLASCQKENEIDFRDFGCPKIQNCRITLSSTEADALIKANITALDKMYTKCGFLYSLSGTMEDAKEYIAECINGEITCPVPLSCFGATLYYKAFITNSYGQRYTTQKYSTHLPEVEEYVSMTVPQITSFDSSSISFQAQIDNIPGSYTISDAGFIWSDHSGKKHVVSCGSLSSQRNTISINVSGYSTDNSAISIMAYIANKSGIKTTSKSFDISISTDKKYFTSIEGKRIAPSVSLIVNGVPDTRYEWTTRDQSHVRVNVNGSLTGVTAGEATLFATSAIGGLRDSCKVKIFHVPSTVDMGTSVLWADMNLGARSVDEVGGYYAWGETFAQGEMDFDNQNNIKNSGSALKQAYSWATYKYCNGTATSLTKYCNSNYWGIVDYYGNDGFNIPLEMSDDASHVVLGDHWRIPTLVEIHQLLDNSIVTSVSDYNGGSTPGIVFTSKTTNQTLFFPISDIIKNSTSQSTDRLYIWSATCAHSWLFGDPAPDCRYAMCLYLYPGSSQTDIGTPRYYGIPIRPVYDSQ